MTSPIAMATLRTQLLLLRLSKTTAAAASLGVPRRSAASRLGPLAGGTATRRGLAQHTGLPGAVGERLWGLGRLNHVAVAVPNLEAATRLYRDVLGAQVSGVVPLPEHGVSTVFVDLGNTKIELLEPLGDKSPIAGFLAKNASGGLHHVCLEVDDLAAALSAVRAMGVRPLGSEPRLGAHGKPVIFLHPKDCSGVLVELEQA
ncbi:methylmalonyl-CoA epimerase, mitochondrial-like [Lethenteron reissneri]|uniref:methylmalonyl-CoA epimerase, mitochondrial-like n=1 Tax=Lethenteron reissneri TaxID=7753 RepID=UPI002AB6E4A8|nr:methylmalonyl-CoA epimerase, mitochondrial-like [Lethenteron reissneri]